MGIGVSVRTSGEALSVSPERHRRMLTELLKSVSRAFYLSMRVLPSAMREPVSIAYLLARAADTIADTASVSTEHRILQLRKFRGLLTGEDGEKATAELSAELTDLQPTGSERELLDSLPEIFALYNGMDAADAERTRAVVLTLTSGMLFDLSTFQAENSGRLTALKAPEQLDEYCHLVAGCVGEFWTAISIAHTHSLVRWDELEMHALGVRFGKALQMTNILRDVPKDLRIGRCYLPQNELDRVGLRAEDLLNAAHTDRARPILAWGILRALDHFSAAERYILAIPRRNLRLRLAALWPVLIGLETLAKLGGSDEWLDPEKRIKISRPAVYGIISLSLLCGRSDTLTRLWIRRIRRRIERTLQYRVAVSTPTVDRMN